MWSWLWRLRKNEHQAGQIGFQKTFQQSINSTERLIKLGIGLFPKTDTVMVLAIALPRAVEP